MRSKAKHAAELDKLAEKGDEALLKAQKAIKTFWEEEEASGARGLDKTADWGFETAGEKGAAGLRIDAWITAEEAMLLKKPESKTKAYLMQKYVGKPNLMLKIRDEVDEEDGIPGVEHRCIIGVHYCNKAKSKGWEVVTNLVHVVELEDGTFECNGLPIPRGDDEYDENPPVDNRENYPINSKLHEWILASEHNDHWEIRRRPK